MNRTLLKILFCLIALPIFTLNAQLSSMATGEITLPDGTKVKTYIAVSNDQQLKGLSSVANDKFKKNMGMLFYYPKDGMRGFWMPDTYFNLDIYFLDKDLKIVAREVNVKKHPGLNEPPKIPKTGTYFCRHVLELRADSGFSKILKVGTKLKWTSSTSLLEKVSGTRPSK